jgi:GTP-binding protein
MAIVENTPGVTRDRNYAKSAWGAKRFSIIDTGGFEPDSQDVLLEQMRVQAQLALEEADVILFVVDARSGVLPPDRQIAEILRRSSKRVILCVNKIDQAQHEMLSYEFYELAFEEQFSVSAEHGYGFGELADAVTRDFEEDEEDEVFEEDGFALSDSGEEIEENQGEEDFEDDDEGGGDDYAVGEESDSFSANTDPYYKHYDEELAIYEVPQSVNYTDAIIDKIKDECIHIAVLGKPNTGKSTLINRLLGYQRLLTADIAGTTRDTIDSELTDEEGQNFVLIDTAGIRRKSSISHRIEKFSVIKALDAVERADVVILVVDAREGLTDQDLKIAAIAIDKGCALCVVLNKWDAIENKDDATATEYIKAAREKISFFEHAPIFTMSALTGQRAHRILAIAKKLYLNASIRIPTGELNRVFQRILQQHSPPTVGVKNLRFYFIQHVAIRPPTFVMQCNAPTLVPEDYKRYLLNQIRAFYGFAGSPIRIILRKPAGRRKWQKRSHKT